MPKTITVDDLKEETKVTDEQLRQKCAIEHLKEISLSVGNYTQFSNRYDIPKSRLAEIETNPKFSFAEKNSAVFLWWRENNPDPTYMRFVYDCLKLGEGEIARKMCRLCKQGVVEDLPYPEKTPEPDTKVPTDSEITPGPPDSPPLKKEQRFCTADDERLEQVDPADASNIPMDAQGGSARLHLLWDVKDVPELKVHFLNPEILKNEGWTCGHSRDPLTASQVLDWAIVWNSRADKYYPRIADEKPSIDDAHIRVEFTGDEKAISWSKVGSAALKVDKKKPTMVLNLYGMTKAEQKSMVIHEFGHVLGLDHEHQRSDFWDVLEAKNDEGQYRFIIGKGQMKNGNVGRCMRACDAVFKATLNEPDGREQSTYDPDSIMHYWFDKNWLLPDYREYADVVQHVTDEKEKRVLLGVHARDYHNGQLAKEPSKLDYETLIKAYSNKANSCLSCAGQSSQCNGDSCPCFREGKRCTPECHCKLDSCQNPNNCSHVRQGMPQTAAAAGPPAPPATAQQMNFEGSLLEEHGSKQPKAKIAKHLPITLTEKDIPTICDKLNRASYDWFNLGLALGVKFGDLKNIQEGYRENEHRLTEMVGKLMKVVDPEHPITWPYICECLRRPTVKRYDVASEIEASLL